MKPNAIGAAGGVGGSLAYLIIVVPTEWLKVLPLIPDPHFLPLVGALGVVLSAILLRTLGPPPSPKDKS